MAEKLILSTPIARTSYEVEAFDLNRKGAHLHALVRGNDGLAVHIDYNGDAALLLIAGLSRGDFRVVSFERQLLERFILDGKLPGGTVSVVADSNEGKG